MKGVAAVIYANRPIPAGQRLLCPVVDSAAPRPGRRSARLPMTVRLALLARLGVSLLLRPQNPQPFPQLRSQLL